MNFKLFDSHAHYYDSRFEKEYEGGAGRLLPRIFRGDVGYIINVGTSNENAELCISQAKRYKNMYAAVGIHPTDCQSYDDAELEVEKIEHLLRDARKNKIVAVGEIGLDYHYDDTDKKKQKEFFRRQLSLARGYDIPVIIHDRDAHGDCFDIVRQYPGVRGVFHSYSGSAEMARELVKLGWYISFSGVVTFKNASKVKEAALAVPCDRILIETDCPYLAPHPHRGELNHSGLMSLTCSALAEIKGGKTEELARITAENAAKLFKVTL